jgi:polyisoprenoid-binding protein YceI
MKLQNWFISFSIAAVIVGCSKNPADNIPAANVSTATNSPAATTPPPAGAAKAFVFGPANSAIEFTGSKVTGKHDGGFRSFTGELSVVNGKLASTGNRVVIDTTSLYSDNDRLTGHLKSPDFFNVKQFTNAVFETTSIETGATNATVTGNLTLHGITKQISFPANVQVAADSVTVNSEFFLNRLDFEMKYPGKPDDLIRKEVVLRLKVKATPK